MLQVQFYMAKRKFSKRKIVIVSGKTNKNKLGSHTNQKKSKFKTSQISSRMEDVLSGKASLYDLVQAVNKEEHLHCIVEQQEAVKKNFDN